MTFHSEAAALGSSQGSGEVDVKAVAAHFYLTPTLNATDLAAAILGDRFGLTEHMARVVCELSGIGGRA